jgi:hypothetical protein
MKETQPQVLESTSQWPQKILAFAPNLNGPLVVEEYFQEIFFIFFCHKCNKIFPRDLSRALGTHPQSPIRSPKDLMVN